MKAINRQELAKAIHSNAVAKGFWDENYSPEHFLMLVITEFSEAVEAHRDGRVTTRRTIDEYIKDSRGEFSPELFKSRIKDSVADELADAYIRLLDLAGGFDWDMSSHYTEYEESATGIKGKTFTESVYHAIDFLIAKAIYQNVCTALSIIEAIAKAHNIDLAWHITEKMRYNETRPAKHGKEY